MMTRHENQHFVVALMKLIVTHFFLTWCFNVIGIHGKLLHFTLPESVKEWTFNYLWWKPFRR